MIVKYIIVSAELLHDLELRVNNLIEKNWQPQGGPFIRGQYDQVHQAMVLIKKE